MPRCPVCQSIRPSVSSFSFFIHYHHRRHHLREKVMFKHSRFSFSLLLSFCVYFCLFVISCLSQRFFFLPFPSSSSSSYSNFRSGVFFLVAGGIISGSFLIIIEVAYKRRKARRMKQLLTAKKFAIKWMSEVQVSQFFIHSPHSFSSGWSPFSFLLFPYSFWKKSSLGLLSFPISQPTHLVSFPPSASLFSFFSSLILFNCCVPFLSSSHSIQ